MNFVAIKMLVGDRAKYLGIIMGLTFASLLITQQAAIFVGSFQVFLVRAGKAAFEEAGDSFVV